VNNIAYTDTQTTYIPLYMVYNKLSSSSGNKTCPENPAFARLSGQNLAERRESCVGLTIKSTDYLTGITISGEYDDMCCIYEVIKNST